MKSVIPAIPLSIALAAVAVLAEEMPTTATDGDSVKKYQTLFDQLDADKNESLTVNEAAAAGLTSEGFSRLDEDGSGELSRDEFIILANITDPASGGENTGE